MRLAERLPTWVPLALGGAAVLVSAVAAVLPALADADRMDRERARHERAIAATIRSAHPAPPDALVMVRDRLRGELAAMAGEDAEPVVAARGDLNEILAALRTIDADHRRVPRSIRIRVEADGTLRLDAALEPVGGQRAAAEEWP